jgi:hypothetical protein
MDLPTIATWIVLVAAVLVWTRRIVGSLGRSSDLMACLFVPPSHVLPWPHGVQESDEPWGWLARGEAGEPDEDAPTIPPTTRVHGGVGRGTTSRQSVVR